MGLGYARLGDRGISFVLSLLKHPFTGFAGASPRAGKRRVPTAAGCRFPTRGVSAHAPMCPEGTEGVLAYWRVAPCNEGLRNAPVDNARVRPSPPVIPAEAIEESGDLIGLCGTRSRIG
jgi:hypothetical protein